MIDSFVPAGASGTLENERLLADGLARLAELLDGLILRDYRVGAPDAARLTGSPADSAVDRLVQVADPVSGTSSGPVLVEVGRNVTPVLLRERLRPQVELMSRLAPDAAVLVVSEWLSPRSRELLDQWNYGYLDLTGNVSLTLSRPLVRMRLDGALRDPRPKRQQGPRRLGGLLAGRLVRVLVDVHPPYTVGELADTTALSLPYVSRLLQSLAEQGLVTRRGRLVENVDWMGLLRARAEERPFSQARLMNGYVAPKGLPAVLDSLREFAKPREGGTRLAVTGPVAAASVAPVAVGGQLMVYVEPDEHSEGRTFGNLPRACGLLAQPVRADVLLVSADDPILLAGTRLVDGVPHVALSQLVLDSLSGPGRGPQEAEELITSMAANTSWRMASVGDWKVGVRPSA